MIYTWTEYCCYFSGILINLDGANLTLRRIEIAFTFIRILYILIYNNKVSYFIILSNNFIDPYKHPSVES